MCAAHQQFRQLVIILRADDEIDGGRAAHDLRAFGLRDAAGDGNLHLPAVARCRVLEFAQPPDLGIDLVARLLADMTGVEDDEIGVVGTRRFGIALARHQIRHALRIVDIHLAAERFDVQLARFRCRVAGVSHAAERA